MLHHIWGVRSEWESSATMAMLSVDYQNAFQSLSHAFIQSVLEYVCLPVAFVCLVMQSLQCDYRLCVGQSVVDSVVFRPTAGIAQGGPLSPLIFSFSMSFICFAFRGLPCVPRLYLYVDDLLFPFLVAGITAALCLTIEALSAFS